MKYFNCIIFCFLTSIVFAQYNCIDGTVYTCNGFVDTETIYGNVQNSNNSISSYTCDGMTLDFLGDGSNGDYGQDDIYIFNSIGESGAFNSMQITLNMDPNSDLDIIAITSNCNYECFSSDSYGVNGTGVPETITLEWEDEQTIILVVETYHLDGGGEYYLEFDYNTLFSYCSYFPYEGQEIDCTTGNTIYGSIFIPNCLTTFPTDCPPSMDYHEGEGPYYGYDQVYTFTPTQFNGNINITLNGGGGVKAFLYHQQFFNVDFVPIDLIASGTNFISANYSMASEFDQFFLIIDSPNSGTYPFDFTINYPGCETNNACGECFSYVDIGNNTCKIDNSLLPSCGVEEWYYTPYPGGSQVNFELGSNYELQFPIAGDYLVCNTNYCTEGNNAEQSSSTIASTCCIVVSVGETCSEAPIAHFTGSANIQGSNNGHINYFNSNTSLYADYYSWHWGDGSTNTTTSTNISHDYFLEPNPVTLCMVASNECGMSKYCISYDTYGDGFFQFDCGLPINPYEPPPIYPTFDGTYLSITDLSFACGAEEITFDPGDGSGEYPINCNGVNYTYSNDGNYVCCVRIKFSCFAICFCYTVNAGGFNCNTDPFILECNESGMLAWEDSTSPNNHSGISTLSNVVDEHFSCTSTIDGCDEENTLSPNVPFARHEVVYEITNPADNHLGDITLDLIMDQSNLDLDIFVYAQCDGNGLFSNCVASSTYDNKSPNGKRDAILLTDIPAYDQFYVVVDGQSNAPTLNEGNFTISYTCGSLCEKETSSIQCGQTIISTTNGSKNEASYYCDCENESPFGPAGNYGPEKIYRLDIVNTSNVTIELDILSNNVDLELYLLNDCSPNYCNRTSRKSAGMDESIQKTLSAGTYYIVVEGFKGDSGDFRLSVSGCETEPVPSNDCDLLYQYNFEGYNDGDLIPTDDNSGNWEYGICFVEDPNDDMLDAVIETRNNDNKLILNSGNYFFSDVALTYENATQGIRKIEWDLVTQYVDDDLYGGTIKLYDKALLLDYSEMLEITFGHDSNGNFAELWYKSFGLVGSQNIKLADIDILKDYSGNDPLPTFQMAYAYNLETNQFTFRINDQVVYTGIFNFLPSNFLEGRVINFATDDEQDYMEIDNIRVYECEDCSIVYDDDCSNIFPVFINQNTNENLTVSLSQSGIAQEDIEGYELVDETTGEIFELESLDYTECIPGHSYKFCIIYFDPEGCLRACCYRMTIPLNCSYFLPFYSGNENQISYSFETQNLPSGYEVEQWQIDGEVIGTGNSISYDYDAPQNSFVCCFIYDPFAKQHILCCYNLCTQIATSCNTLSYISNDDGTYSFSVSNAEDILSWNIDEPANLPNNGKIENPANFNPSDYGIAPGQSIWVSVRYIDINGCVRVCCIEITIPLPQDAVIFDINDACGPVGSTIQIPLQVYNFTEVGIVGFELHSADKSKVKLEGIVNKAPQFASLDFNTVNDRIILGWDEPTGGNISVADGTRMFDIEVTLLEDFDDAVILYGTQLEVLGDEILEGSINPGNVCISGSTQIFGSLYTYNSNPLAEVEVNLEANNSMTTYSGQEGEYGFQEVLGDEVVIRPHNNDNIRQGVSIVDVALIRKHYLQVDPLDNPYKMMAADVNKSGTITNTDVALARRIYLQVITEEIPNNSSWRFVPSDLDISGNPLDITIDDHRTLVNPSGNIGGQDFIGVKVADVNNSTGLKSEHLYASKRSVPLKFIVEDQTVQAGTMVTIPINVEDFANIALFGFEILWDQDIMSLTEISSSLDGFSGQNYNILDGKAILGWDEPNGGALNFPDGTLLSLNFEIAPEAMGSTSLEFNLPEVLDGDFNEVETTFDSGTISIETTSVDRLEKEGIKIYPNPFHEDITIDLSEVDGKVNVNIVDVNGKLVWQYDGTGKTEIKVGNEEIVMPGIYMIRIVTQRGEYVKRVVRI